MVSDVTKECGAKMNALRTFETSDNHSSSGVASLHIRPEPSATGEGCLGEIIALLLEWRGTIILPVLYGCETWSLTLKEERRLGAEEDIWA